MAQRHTNFVRINRTPSLLLSLCAHIRPEQYEEEEVLAPVGKERFLFEAQLLQRPDTLAFRNVADGGSVVAFSIPLGHAFL